MIELALERSDYIFLGYGAEGGQLLHKLNQSEGTKKIVDKFYSMFTEQIDRIYWLGRTKLGYPMHTGAHGFKELQSMSEVDLRLALGMRGDE